MQHELLSGVLGMIEKVAVSKLMASHTQIRKGRRPYRVSTLLERDKPMHDVPELLKDAPEKVAAEKLALKSSTIESALAKATSRASKAAVSSGVKQKSGEGIMDYVRRAAPREHRQVETFTRGLGRARSSEQAALRAVEPGLRQQMRSGEEALRKFEASQLGKSASLAGFFDELDKIASRGMSRLARQQGGAVTPEEVARWKDVVKTEIPGGITRGSGIPGTMKVHGDSGKSYLFGGQPGSSAESKAWFSGKAKERAKLFSHKPTFGSRVGGLLKKIVGEKVAGVGVDLRLLKKSGVTNISMPTEESLAQAKSKLERTQRVGGDLKVKPPEPNIRAVATKVK
jgi:hypothetical protein